MESSFVIFRFGLWPSTCWETLESKLLCVSITPLGKPVVPDENGRHTTSSGCMLTMGHSFSSASNSREMCRHESTCLSTVII
jgi:hypothetical protein